MDNTVTLRADVRTPPDARDEIFKQLKDIITDIIGADAAEIVGIYESSAFVGDLEMDSIQIVSFAEEVRNRYGDRINFTAWLSKIPLRKIVKLKVGDVVDYIGPALR
jgi:acyl carrier protein